MPKNKRQYMIQELERAEGNLDWVRKHIDAVGREFAEYDRVECETLLTIDKLTVLLKDNIKLFREHI